MNMKHSTEKDDNIGSCLCILFSCVIIFVFGLILGLSQTFTIKKTCVLVNKRYEIYSCADDVDLCGGVSSCIYPCNGQNYKLLYEVQVVGDPNVVTMCAGSSFSTLSFPECTCIIHGSNRYGGTTKTIELEKERSACEPIIVPNLDDYNSKTIGQTLDCWIGDGHVGLNDKSIGQYALEISSICLITLAAFSICCSLLRYYKYKFSKSHSKSTLKIQIPKNINLVTIRTTNVHI